MVPLQPQFAAVLERVLSERFLPHPPAVLVNDTPAKQISRAFSGYAMNKLLDVSPSEAANVVVDHINDNGPNSIYFHDKTKTLLAQRGQ